jgi:hypothetical protein
VFGALMKNGIRSNVNGGKIVTEHKSWSLMLSLKLSNLILQVISLAVAAIALYSASAELLEMVVCFFF